MFQQYQRLLAVHPCSFDNHCLGISVYAQSTRSTSHVLPRIAWLLCKLRYEKGGGTNEYGHVYFCGFYFLKRRYILSVRMICLLPCLVRFGCLSLCEYLLLTLFFCFCAADEDSLVAKRLAILLQGCSCFFPVPILSPHCTKANSVKAFSRAFCYPPLSLALEDGQGQFFAVRPCSVQLVVFYFNNLQNHHDSSGAIVWENENELADFTSITHTMSITHTLMQLGQLNPGRTAEQDLGPVTVIMSQT